MISFGSYQVQQARCYLSNHLYSNNNDLTVFYFSQEIVENLCCALINPDMDPLLLMINLKSRFVSQTVHRLFVLMDNNATGFNCVIAYCCTCKSGNRTVGYCAHVMSLIYFICFARNGVKEVSKHLKNIFDENNWDGADEDEAEDME